MIYCLYMLIARMPLRNSLSRGVVITVLGEKLHNIPFVDVHQMIR